MDSLDFGASPRASAIDWAVFLKREAVQLPSPLDEFYIVHMQLTALSGAGGLDKIDVALQPLLARQLLLGYISTTELYMRRLLARVVPMCPFVRRKAAQCQIPFGALDFYTRLDLAHSLTERTTFSEPGKIANLLSERFGIKVAPKSSLKQAIDDFETLCQLRHALVHSGGVVNSTNAQPFDLPRGRGPCVVSLQLPQLQSSASVCMNLARAMNEEVSRHVLWTWVREGYLSGRRDRDRPKLEAFIQVFASENDLRLGRALVPSPDVLHDKCMDIATALSKVNP